MRRLYRRRGMSLVQWVLIAAVVILGVAAGITVLGTHANNKLNQTATDVANPASLTTRFGS